jgi:plastocyanin/sugar lactone lactonase YvrE
VLVVVSGLGLSQPRPLLAATAAQQPTTVAVYATGLINPKGLAFTPDGALYVAESGAPGDVTVALPSGYGGRGPVGSNGRISRVRPGGAREDVITGLPNIGIYGGIEMLGASGLAVLDGQLYEVAAAHITVSPTVSRVSPDGAMTPIADIGLFNKRTPAARDNGDAIPTGNPFGMVALKGALYVTDGNYNRVFRVLPDGTVSVLVEFANDPTSTGIAAGPDGALYVAQFGLEPYPPGSARVDRVALDGTVTEGAVRNLTNPIGVAFTPDGTMYVLQFVSEFDPVRRRYAPFGGKVLRVEPDGSTTEVVNNLMFPTAMTFGPDGALYVSNYGNEGNQAKGQILRIRLGDTVGRGPDVSEPDDPKTAATPPPRATPTPAPADVQPAATVTIVENSDPQKWGYDPKETTIDAGQSVKFTNGGQVIHTATASDGAFDSGLLKGGESKVIKFDVPGTYAYFCQPHPWMKGQILVRGAGSAIPTPAPPVAAVAGEPSPPGINVVRAVGFVAVLIGVVFLAGFLIRRRGGAEGPAG